MNQPKGGRKATVARWAARVERALETHAGGLTKEEIASRVGLSVWVVRKALVCSSKRGGVFHRRESELRGRWWHAAYRASYEAEKASSAAAVKAESEAKKAAAAVQRKARAAAKVGQFKHRQVRVSDVVIVRPTCPASVWGLAA